MRQVFREEARIEHGAASLFTLSFNDPSLSSHELQVRTFDLKTPERRHFSSILMSAIMSVRAAASSLDNTESIWRPVSMGPVVGVEENHLRASFGRGAKPTQLKATALGPQPWVSDDERRSCTLCDRKFHTLFRKHHCRMCGIIICSKCSPSRVPLPDLGYQNLVRVCNPCFARRDVQNPFDALDEKFTEGETLSAVSSAATLQTGMRRPDSVLLPPSALLPLRAVASDVARCGHLESPASSLSLGHASPPLARSAFHVVADAQKRTLDDSRK